MEKEIKEIKCDVTNCVYHHGATTCAAGHIAVGGSHACSCSETACNTFEPVSEKSGSAMF